jgi:hypothetical protein
VTTVVLTALVVGTIGYVVGAVRVANRHDRDVEWLVGSDRCQATAIRLLYALLEQPCPDMDVERQPEPSSWAKLRQAAKDRHPAGSRIEAEPVAVIDVAEFVPDPDPTTNPIPVQGPATQPAAAVIDDGWEQERDAAYALMLAEIRGAA